VSRTGWYGSFVEVTRRAFVVTRAMMPREAV
jgi:hypothetical protein